MTKAGWFTTVLLVAGLVIAAPVLAGQAPEEGSSTRQELDKNERKLQDAQRRLEEAAREIAELASGMQGPVTIDLPSLHFGGGNRAMLGVNISNADPGMKGVKVVGVSPGGPAAEAGVKSNDLIVALDGKAVGSGRDLLDQMRDVEPGQKVKLDLIRDGKPAAATVLAKPREDMLVMMRQGMDSDDMRDMPMLPHVLAGPFGDAELVSMTPGLGRYFGSDKGLLVVQVPAAAGTGLEEGDVILAIGGREPHNAHQAMRILGSYEAGDSVELKVLRQRKERTVRLTVPDEPKMKRHHMMMPPSAPPAPDAPPPPPPK